MKASDVPAQQPSCSPDCYNYQYTWDNSIFFSTGLGVCFWVLLFVSFLQLLLFCSFVIYWSSPVLAPSPLGFRSQLFLDKRYWISLRCQRFCEVMLDLTFHFAPYVQWITAAPWARAVRYLGQGANLFLSPQADLALPQLPVATEVGYARCNSLACYRRWQRWFRGHLPCVPLARPHPKADPTLR